MRSTAAPAECTVRCGADLAGTVRVGGFKHALVPLLAASVLASGPVKLRNVPRIEDSRVMAAILAELGAEVDYDPALEQMSLDTRAMSGHTIPHDLARLVHGPVYLLPVLLARFGRAQLGPTGGCRIGPSADGGTRPVGHLVDIVSRFGADVTADDGTLVATCTRLRGAHIDLREYAEPGPAGPTGPLYSGATKCALLAAAGAEGTTVLEYPYPKPDVTALADGLATGGVELERTADRIVVRGIGGVAPFSATLLGDLIEFITFVACAVHARGALTIAGTDANVRAGLSAELDYLEAMGVGLEPRAAGIEVSRPERLRAVDVAIASHGAFSDSHPFFSLMLLGGDRPSRIIETVWRDRFGYVEPLRALGADLRVESGQVEVRPSTLTRRCPTVRAGDLRSAAMLVLAALTVPGPTTVAGVEHLSRGYDDLLGKLRSLGARIE